MTKIQHLWYTPVVIFGWAAACIGRAVQIFINGEFKFRWTDASEQFLVRPDTHPFALGFSVSALFAIGLASAVAGIFVLRAFLRERKKGKRNEKMAFYEGSDVNSEILRERGVR